MPKSVTSCNEENIEGFLNGSLDENSASTLMEHLHSCLDCRKRMEASAADHGTWSDAERFLRMSDMDVYQYEPSQHLPVQYQPGSWTSEFDEAVSIQRIAISAEISQVLSQLDPTDDPQMLGRLGGYEVSGVIGSGGMGIVLKAFDRPLDRTVAIKVLAPRLASSGAARLRFAREAKAAATVLHPNVIVIHGVSNEGTMPFLVMPYLRGESLQRRLDRQGSLGTEDVLRIAQQIASGLAAAHGQGLIHRDIKPANIMLEDGVERVTLTDFGLARAVDDASMTRSGVVAGTPQYMSPEQARGDNLDARSDLFSLGSVIYAMCTGRPPFRADSSYGTLRRITDTEPRPIRELNPSIPEWLERIVQRLHAKHIDQRFSTADELANLLQKCIAHLQQPLLLELPEECQLPVRRRRLWPTWYQSMTAMALITLICIVIAGVQFFSNSIIRNPIQPESHSATQSQEPTSTEDQSALSSWETLQSDIEAFEKELDSSEHHSGRLWTRNPEAKPR